MKRAFAFATVGLAVLFVLGTLFADDKGSASGSAKGSGSASASASSSASGSSSSSGSGTSSASKSSSAPEKFTKVSTELCKVVSFDKDKRTLTLEKMTVDQKAAYDLQQQIAAWAKDTNPVTRQQKYQDILQKQGSIYKPSGIKFDVKAEEDYLIRTKTLSPKFDEKGNIVDLAKEMKERADKKHPGYYTAGPEDLHQDAVVEVTLVKKENSKAKLPDILGPRFAPKPGEEVHKTLDDEIMVSFIVITSDK